MWASPPLGCDGGWVSPQILVADAPLKAIGDPVELRRKAENIEMRINDRAADGTYPIGGGPELRNGRLSRI
jgi:hypothetical protein